MNASPHTSSEAYASTCAMPNSFVSLRRLPPQMESTSRFEAVDKSYEGQGSQSAMHRNMSKDHRIFGDLSLHVSESSSSSQFANRSRSLPRDFPPVNKRRTDSDGDKTEATMTTCTVTTASSASIRSDNSTIHSDVNDHMFSSEESHRKQDHFHLVNAAILTRRRLLQEQNHQAQNQQLQDQKSKYLSPAFPKRASTIHSGLRKGAEDSLARKGRQSNEPLRWSSLQSSNESTTSIESTSPSSLSSCTDSILGQETINKTIAISYDPSFSSTSTSAKLNKSTRSSASTCSGNKNRQVHFVSNDDYSAEPITATFPGISALTSDEKSAVWWQPLDFKLFRRYCKRAAELARQSQYTDEFTAVYDACSGKHIHDMMEFCHISRSHVRGLEIVVFPALIQARKLVVRGVVKAQEKLPADMSPEQRAKILSATSRCLSGRARLLARVYGVGDEEVAKDCYYSMGKEEVTAAASNNAPPL